MSETVLNAEAGRTTGSASTRRLRRLDQIPAVVYGHGMTPMSIAVDRRELRTAVSGTAGLNTILDLTVGGDVYPSLIKDIQRHPVRRSIQHIDFIQVNLNEEIPVAVPVRLEGEAKDVLQTNGLVDLAMTELEVVTTPRNIPDEFVIDVTEMTLEDVVRVADVPLPAGVTATAEEEAPVVTVLTIRIVEEVPEEEELEGEEGELAEGDAEAAVEGDSDSE